MNFTIIVEKLNSIIEYLNSVRANSKRIDELPDATTGDKYVAVWNPTAGPGGLGQTQKQLRAAFVNQNNKGRKIILGYFTTNNPLSEAVIKINQGTYTIAEDESPVIFEAQQFNTVANAFIKYVFMWMGGKGTWGQGGTVVTANRLFMFPAENITVQDINPDASTVILPLGQLADQDAFLIAANSQERDFSDPAISYYFSYYILENEGTVNENNILYIALFTGDPAIYGAGDPANEDFVITDFAPITNSNVPPGPATPGLEMVLNMGYQANGQIGLFSQPNTPQSLYQEFWAGGFVHENAAGSMLEIKYSPLAAGQHTLWVPAITQDDEFALLSQINGLGFSVDQASANLSITNIEGETLATVNLAFLNNEATAFSYNSQTNSLELRDAQGTLLSSIPVSNFVSGIAQSASWSQSTPSTLQFKDPSNNVVYSATFSISNIAGLQDALTAAITADATISAKGKIKLAGDLGGTADAPLLLKISSVADPLEVQRRAITVGPTGNIVAEDIFEFEVFDDTASGTGYATLAAINAQYPSIVNSVLVRPKGFTVYCYFMTNSTIYKKCGDNDAYWLKIDNTGVHKLTN